MKDTLTVKLFKAPHGRMELIEMSNVYQQEIDFFNDNDIIVSMEDVNGIGPVIYGCPASDVSEESEVMVFAKGRSCQDTMIELRELCEKAFL